MSRLWANLTPAQQQLLLPYVARPTDPASVYSTPPAAALFGDSGDELLAAGGSDRSSVPPSRSRCARLALHRGEALRGLVVRQRRSDDRSVPAKRQAAAAIAEQVWALETPSMGEPRPDDYPFDATSRTPHRHLPGAAQQVHPASPQQRLHRALVPEDDRGGGAGFAVRREPRAADVERLRAAAPGPDPDAAPAAGAVVKARSDFAHEFFHLLTYGLNLEAQGGACSDPVHRPGRQDDLADRSLGDLGGVGVHAGRRSRLSRGQVQPLPAAHPSAESLLDNHVGADNNPAYQAFVYPLFLSQEAGGRAPFEDFWKGRGARARPRRWTTSWTRASRSTRTCATSRCRCST